MLSLHKEGPEGPTSLERATGSNLRMMAWEAIALPLGDTRNYVDFITVFFAIYRLLIK